MPVEECRNVYLGVTPSHIYVYLGKASADLASFFYEKAGIEFQTEKTSIVVSVDDFCYLDNIGATVFKRKKSHHDIVNDLKVILDAYDIYKDNGHKMPENATRTRSFCYKRVYYSVDIIMYNKTEKVAIYVANIDLPEYNGDSIITCTEWIDIASYMPEQMQQVTVTGDKVVQHACNLFHRQKFDYDDLYKQLCAFKDLYIKTKTEEKVA